MDVALGPQGLEVNAGSDGPGPRPNPCQPSPFVCSRWNKWALSRGKRELRVSSSSYPTGLADMKAGLAETIIQPQDVKGPSRGTQAR